MSKSWAGGSTRSYRRIRVYVLRRDGFLCQVRLPGVCTRWAPLDGGHVHHTRGRAVTGDDPAYMVASCESCNLAVGDPTVSRVDPTPAPLTDW